MRFSFVFEMSRGRKRKDATSVTDRNPDRGDGGRDAGREAGRDAEDVRRGREEGLAALRILEATRLADVGAAR
ncbi:MAG: hypothetical protein EB012_12955, partial [Gammaproteobacteria bacterium]|nr:hypothetical protein [Gammaproteobacteria bacterium]